MSRTDYLTYVRYLCVNVATDKDSLLLLCVYRPGSQAVTAEFFDELTLVLEQISVQRRPCIICGDFNIHIDDDNDVHAKKLGELLQTFDWIQHVREPTHTAGHILDVVISRCDTEVQQLSVGSFVSDHAVVNFKLNLRQQATSHLVIVRRRWRNLIAADFETDLAASRLCADLTSLADLSPDDLVDLYDSEMMLLLDKHYPKVTVRQKRCKLTPWFDAECRASRRRVRAAERRYRRRRTDADKRICLTRLKSLRVFTSRRTSCTGAPRSTTLKVSAESCGELYRASWVTRRQQATQVVTQLMSSRCFSLRRWTVCASQHPQHRFLMFQQQRSKNCVIGSRSQPRMWQS